MKKTRIFPAPPGRAHRKTLLKIPAAIAFMAALFFVFTAQAATITWDGAGSDWNTIANWGGGTVPSAADIAEFNLVSSTQPNIGATTNASAGALWVATGVGQTEVIGATTGGTLTIAGNQTVNGYSNTGILVDNTGNYGLTINAPLSVTNSTSFLVNNASQLAIHGALTITAAKTLTLGGTNAAGSILIDGAIAATSGALTVNTLGTVTLSGNNANTGVTTLLNGTLIAANNANALGLGTLTLSGGILDLANASGGNLNFGRNTTINANTTIISDITAGSGSAGNTYTLGTLAIGGQQLNILAGSNVTSGTAGVTFGATTLSNATAFNVGSGANLTLGLISGNKIIFKQGVGMLTLNGASTNTGAAYITSGTVVQNTVNGFGTVAVTLYLSGNSTLDLATDTTTNAYPVTLLGNATILSDRLTPSSPGITQTLGTLTSLGANTLTIGKGSNVSSSTGIVAFGVATMNANTTFSVGSGAQLTLNSTLANGGFTPTFTGAGNTTVTGAISGGGGLIMNGTGLLTLTAANTYTGANAISGGTVTLGNVASLGATATAVLNMTGGTLNVAGVGSTLLSLNGNASSSIISSGAATLTINPTANTTGSFGGNIGTGVTALAVTVNGIGAMTLSGNNAYTGLTTLTAGQLNINSNTALGTSTFTLTTGIIDNTSSSNVTLTNNNNITLSGSFTFGGSGNLSFGTGTLTNAATPKALNLMGSNGSVLTIGTWNNNVASAVTNIYAMPGSNSTVSIGKFISTSTATAGTIGGNGNIIITGGIQPGTPTGASIVYSSVGTLTLSGTSTYTGATTFNAGTVILDARSTPAILNAATAPTFAGGTFIFKGDAVATSQTLGAVTVAAGGASSIQVVGGAAGTTLTTGTITDTANNGVLNINVSGANSGVAISGTTTNSLIGARGAITFTSGGTTSFATITSGTVSALTIAAALPGSASVSSTNYILTNASQTVSATESINALQINNTSGAGQGVNIATGRTLTITSGGILYTGDSLSSGSIGGLGTLKSNSATNSDLIIHNFGAGGLTIGAVIADGNGASVLTLDGPGVTTLSASNSYTGVTQVGGGATLSISANSGLGAVGTGAALTLNNGTLQATSTFSLDNAGANIRAITLNAGGGTFDVTGTNTLTESGVISGIGSLTKIGTGTLLLKTGVNTYSGGFTNIQNGALQLGGAAGSIAATNMVVLGNSTTSGTLILGDASYVKAQTVAGLFTQGSGGASNAIIGGGLTTGTSTLTFAGSLLTPSNFAGTIGGGGTGQNNLALTITGGVLTLSGNNTYSGITTMSTAAGVLNINSNTAIGSGSLALTFATAVIDNTSGSSVTMTNNNNVSTTTGFVFGGANNLSFGTGFLSTTLASTPISVWGNSTLTFGGGLINNVAAGAALTLTVNGSTGTLSLGGFNMQGITGGVITDIIAGSGNVNITGAITPGNFNATNGLSYTGSGILTLSGSNSYQGATTMNNAGGGILKFGPGFSTYSSGTNGALILTAGAIDLGGQSVTVGAFTATAGLVTSSASNGSITSNAIATANVANWGGNLSANLTMASGAAVTAISGNFYNTGSLTLNNASANAFTVSGASVANLGNITFNANSTGAFTVSAASLNNTGTITNSGTGTGTTTISSVIGTNVSSIIQSSTTSMLNLAGSDLATNGKFIILSGTLQAGNATALGTYPVIWDGGTFSNNAALTVSQLLSVSGGVGANNVYLTSGILTIGDANNLSTTINGTVAGTGGITLGGNGTLTLAGTSTYTGATTIATGTLNITGVVNGSTAIALSNGGLLLSGSGALSSGTLTVTGGTVTELADYAMSGSAALTVNASGLNYLISRVNSNTGTTTLTSGTLMVSNTGALTNSPVALTGGVLALRSDVSATFATPAITVGGATTIDVNQQNPGNINNTLSVGLINLGASILTITGGNGYSFAANALNVTGNGTWAPTTANATFASGTIASGATLTLGGAYSGTLSNVSGAGGITFNNALGTLAITGTSNTYAGLTTLTAGVLQLSNTGALASSSGLTFAGGTLQLRSDAASPTFATGASGYTLNSNAGIDVNQLTSTGSNGNFNIGTLNLGIVQLNLTGGNGDSLTVGALNVTNNAILNPTTATLIVNSGTVASGKTLTYTGLVSGTISSISGAGGVSISAPGNTWTMAGNNTYTGATNLSFGALQLSSTGALANTSGLTLTSGTLQLRSDSASTFATGTSGFVNVGGATTIDVNQAVSGSNTQLSIGAVTLSNVALTVTGGNGYSLGTGTVTLTAAGTLAPNSASLSVASVALGASTLTLGGTGSGIVTGTIGGAGGITKNTAATWTLAGLNTYAGATSVSVGTMIVSGTMNNVGLITVNGGGSLTETVDNALAGTTALAINNTNSLVVLSNSNSYSGGTTFTTGTLLVTNAGGLGSGALVLNGAGFLQLRSDTAATFTTNTTTVSAATTIDVNQKNAGSNQQLSIGAVNLGAFALTVTGGNGYSLGTGTVTLTGAGTLTPNSASISVASVALASNTLTLAGTSYGIVTGTIGGAGGITKNTGATWTLAGLNTYTGLTTVTAGSLIVSGTMNNVGTIQANGGLLTETVANAFTGSTSLTGSNGGVIVLSQPNNYTGATNLSVNGYLMLSNTGAIASSALTISSSGQSILSLRNDGSGTFAAASVAMTPMTLGSGVLATTIDVNRATTGGASNGVLTLSGTLNATAGYTSDTLTITGENGYSLALPFLNVATATTLSPITANVSVASGTLGQTLTLAGALASTGNTIGALSGTGGVTLGGNATWTMTGGNTYTGATAIGNSNETLIVTGSFGNTAITINSTQGATLSLRNAGAVSTNTLTMSSISGQSVLNETVDNALSGNAALTISGAGAQALLTNANNFTGATNVSGGLLRLSSTNAIQKSALTLSGGILQLRSDTSTTFNASAVTLSGGTVDVGALSTSGSNQTLSLTGTTTNTVTLAGNATVSFTGSNGDALSLGNVNLTANAGLSPTGVGLSITTGTVNGSTLTLAGTTSGTVGALTGTSGAVTLNTANNWTLTGTNTYTGNTAITTGTMNITGMMGNTALTLNSGGLVLGGSGALNQKTLTVTTGTVTETVNNGLAGTVAMTISGGAVILNYANNTVGATTFNSGVLQLSNTGALATSAVIIGTNTTLQLRADIASTFAMASTTVGGAATIDVNQATTSGSNTQLSLGALSIGAQTLTSTGGNGYSLGLGAVTQTGASTFNPTTANMNIASIGGAYNLTLSGSTSGNTVGAITIGAGTLTKNGVSTWVLNGINTFTGSTTVSSGTLQISGANGSLASTAINPNGGILVFDNTTAAGGNNNNRIADAAQFNLGGGSVLYKGSDTGNSTETFNIVQVNPGYSIFTVAYNGTGTAILSGSSFFRAAAGNNGTVLINGANLGLDNTSSASVARFKIATAPTLVGTTAALNSGVNSAVKNTQIVPFLLGESAAGAGTQTGTANTFLTYNANTGFRPLDPTAEFTHASIGAGNNIYIDNATTASTTASINSLVINGGDLTLGSGAAITDASGAILFVTSNSILKDPSTSGTLAFGATEALVTVNAGVTGTISAPITGSGANGLTKSGLGTLVLGGTNTYTGTTSISSGTLQLGAANSLFTTGTLTVNVANTVFDLNGYNQTLANVQDTVGIVTNSGAAATLTVGNGSRFPGGNLTGNLSLVWNQGATAENDTITTVTNTGDITLNANGAGTIGLTALFNNTGNIYNSGTGTAAVTVNAAGAGANLTGIYQNSTTSILKLQGTFGANAGLTINSGTVQVVGALTTGTNGLLTVNNSGVFDLNNNVATTGLISSASTTGTITNTGAAVKVLTVSGTTTANYAGVLAGKTSLTVLSGTQILSGNNTFTGAIIVGANTPTGTVLQINGASAMNTATGLTLGSGVILALRGDSDAAYLSGTTTFSTNSITATIDVNQLTSAGSNHILSLGAFNNQNMDVLNITGGNGYTLGLGAVGAGQNGLTINAITGNVSIASAVWTVGNNLGINTSANTNNFISTVNANSGGLGFSKKGDGTLTLTGAYSGTTNFTVAAGTLIVGGTAGTITGGTATYPNVYVNGTGTLNLQRANALSSAYINMTVNGTLTENVDAAISGSTALLINSYYATANLWNNNTYTGATTLTLGTLVLGSSNALVNSSAVNLNGNFLKLRNDNAITFNTPVATAIGANLLIDVNQTTAGHTGNTLTLSNVSIGAFTLTAVGGNGYSLGLGTVTETGAATYTANTGLNIASITGATFGVTVGGGANSTIGNITTTTGGVTKNGAGTLTLNGAASTFTGAITINGGILNVTTAAISGTNTTNGITITTEGILQAAAASTGTISKALTLTGIGTFDLNGSATTLGGVISAGTFVVMDSGATPGTLTLTNTNLFTSLYLLGGTTNAATANINASGSPIVFNGGTLQSASGGISATKVITLGNLGGTIDATSGNTVTLSGVVAGPGALTKTNTGVLLLSGANVAFGGGLVINNGVVQAATTTVTAFGQGNVTFGTSNTPTLDINGLAETIGYLSGAGTNGIVQDSGATAVLTLCGTGTASYAGLIRNSSGPLAITKAGPGTQILNGAVTNSYTGATLITGGLLKLDFSNMVTPANLIYGSTALTMQGGTLSILGQAGTATSQSIASLAANAGEDSIVLAPSSGTTTLTITSATVTRSAGATVNFDTSAGTPSTAMVAWNPVLTNGLISGAHTITDNTGTAFATVVNGNIVRLTGTSTLRAGSSVSTTNFNTAPTDAGYASGTLTLTNAAHALNTLTIASGAGGTLDLGGNAMTLTAQALLMTGAGNYAITDGTIGAAATELIVHQFGSGTMTLGANISSGAGILTKDGTGTLVLTASNNYSGGTTLLGGVTQISSNSNLGAAAGTVQLYGGTLEVTSAGFDLARSLNVKNAGGTLQVDSGTLTESGGIYLDNKAYLTIQGAGNLNITGLISDTGVGGGLIFASSYTGVTTLSGNNANSGGIILNGGTLIATNNANALGQSLQVNGLQMNGGTLVLSNTSGAGITFNRNVAVGGNTQIVSDVAAGTGTTGNTYIFGTLAIGNNTLTVAGGTNVTSGVAGVNFMNTTLMGANSTFNIQDPLNGGTTLLNLNDVIGTGTLTLTGNGNFTQRTALTNWIGTSGLTLDSNYTGLATLIGNNTFTGGLTIKSGTLTIGTGVTGATGIATTLGAGTIYLGDTTGSAHNASLLLPVAATTTLLTVQNNIVVQSGNAGSAILGGIIPANPTLTSQYYNSPITFTGAVTLNKDLVISPFNTESSNASNNAAASGLIFNNLTGQGGIIVSATGAGFSSSGQSFGINTGVVSLVNTNEYQGDTRVYSGVLNLVGTGDVTSWLGTSSNAVIIGDKVGSQTARFNLALTTAGAFNRNITTQAGSGGLAIVSANTAVAAAFNGNLTLNKSVNLNIGSASSYAGNISDAPGAIGGMSVAVTSVGMTTGLVSNVILSGSNTYDGGTVVESASILTGSSAGAFGLGNVVVNGGYLRLSSTNNLAANKTVLVNAMGALSINSTTLTQANLQAVLDKNSSGGITLASGIALPAATNLDMSQLGNGYMYLGVDGAANTYAGTTLGANIDGNYRLGWGSSNNAYLLYITNGVLVDSSYASSGHSQLVVGSAFGNNNGYTGGGTGPLADNPLGYVILNGTNTYSGGTVVNNGSSLTGVQATVAGASPFGSSTGAMTLRNSILQLNGNGGSTVVTNVGAFTFDGQSQVNLTATYGVNTLAVGQITRSGSGTLIISQGSANPAATLGSNVILLSSGVIPTVGAVDTNGLGTANATMVAPYILDLYGNYLTYNATTGFTPIVTSVTTTDGALANSYVRTPYSVQYTTISSSGTIAALSLGSSLQSSANQDITLMITTGGLNGLSYNRQNQNSNNSLAIGSNGATGHINLDFAGQEAVIMTNGNQNGGAVIYNNITNTGGHGLTKGGGGCLSLVSTTSDFTGTITVNGNGGNIFNSGIQITSDLNLGGVGAALNNGLTLNGGQLMVYNQGNTTTLNAGRTVTIGEAGAYINIGGNSGSAGGTPTTANSVNYGNLIIAGYVTGTGAALNIVSTANLTAATSSTFTLTNTANDFQAPIYIGVAGNARLVFAFSDDRQLGNTSNVVNLQDGDSVLQYTGTTSQAFNHGLNFSSQGGYVDVVNNVTLTANGPITGSDMFQKNGNGTLAITGSNSFIGSVTINAGIINASNSYALGVSDAVVSGTTGVSGAPVYVESTGELDLQNSIALGGAGGKTLYLSGTGISGAGALHSISGVNSNAGQVVLQADTTIGVDADSLTLAGQVSGAANLTKVGAGTLALSASNSYTGVTNVNAGILSVSNSYGLGNSTGGAVNVVNGTQLDIQGNITLGGAGGKVLNLNGSGISGAGALHSVSGTNSNAGQVNLQGNTTIGVDADSLTLSGTVSGGANLTKVGAGTLALSASNSYTGTTTVSAGTLAIGTVVAQGSIAGAVNVNNGAAFAGNGSTGALTVHTGATLAPGDLTTGKGTLTASSLTLEDNVTLQLAVTKDASGTAGTDYAKLSVGSALDLSAITHITVSLHDVLGDATSFDANATKTVWQSVIATTSLTGFNTSQFTIDSSNFNQGALYSGGFTLVQNQTNINSLDLVYMVPEPQTWAMFLGGIGLLGFVQRMRRRIQN